MRRTARACKSRYAQPALLTPVLEEQGCESANTRTEPADKDPSQQVMESSVRRKSPHKVFTPRRAAVNPDMYVDRPELERSLVAALRGSQHLVISGESGSGKSWLYKQVLSRNNMEYRIANLANASRKGSIEREIADACLGAKDLELAELHTSTGVGVDAGFKGEIGAHRTYVAPSQDLLLRSLTAFRKRMKSSSDGFVVLDNLETIFDNDRLMRELGDMITLSDDERYASTRIRLVVVGVPEGVREYFARVKNRETVSNRLYELPEVARLSEAQAHELVRRGFVQELQIQLDDCAVEALARHVSWITDRIPQRMHEYCLQLALLIEGSGWHVSGLPTRQADMAWTRESLSNAYATLRKAMNERETRVGRRNQVLYCLGKMPVNRFRYDDVERLVRSEFPMSTSGKTLNVSGILAELERSSAPIIRRDSKGDAYVFSDPRYRMVMRVVLRKDDERVIADNPEQVFE